MEELISFAKGPLFRFTFSIMILGLLRIFILTLINGLEAKNNAKDKTIPNGYVGKMTVGFIIPLRAFRVKPFYATISIVFHIGLILTPIFLFDHSLLLQNSIGFSWIGITLPKGIADILTMMTIFTGSLLVIIRIGNRTSRFISRKQDFLWPLLLVSPFITGLVCSQITTEPATYNIFMLIHISCGCLIFLLIPLTKIAHCVLLPLSQWITARAWKFPSEGAENVAISLGKQGEKL